MRTFKHCMPLVLWIKFNDVKANIVHNPSIFEKVIEIDLGATSISYNFERKEN
tara:strand:+ start:190 stop:348 length:159 start_codon:yes stop_codon:yes gene_type:complete